MRCRVARCTGFSPSTLPARDDPLRSASECTKVSCKSNDRFSSYLSIEERYSFKASSVTKKLQLAPLSSLPLEAKICFNGSSSRLQRGSCGRSRLVRVQARININRQVLLRRSNCEIDLGYTETCRHCSDQSSKDEHAMTEGERRERL